jgi:hypothetical protein
MYMVTINIFTLARVFTGQVPMMLGKTPMKFLIRSMH